MHNLLSWACYRLGMRCLARSPACWCCTQCTLGGLARTPLCLLAALYDIVYIVPEADNYVMPFVTVVHTLHVFYVNNV